MKIGLSALPTSATPSSAGYLPEPEYKELLGLGIEHDLYFEANRTLSECAEAAPKQGRIVA